MNASKEAREAEMRRPVSIESQNGEVTWCLAATAPLAYSDFGFVPTPKVRSAKSIQN